MNPTRPLPASRVFAELPNGDIVEPGVSPACPGFDIVGVCNAAHPDERPCAGATWRYEGEIAWRFTFHAGSGMCPAVLLDPLGLAPVPGD
jgi:hypothetical protein